MCEMCYIAEEDDPRYVRAYYSAAVGGTITKVTTRRNESGIWPSLHVEMPDGTKYRLVPSRDGEANGPGVLYGLPAPDMPLRRWAEDEEAESASTD